VRVWVKRLLGAIGALVILTFILKLILPLVWSSMADYVNPATSDQRAVLLQMVLSVTVGLISGGVIGVGGLVLSWWSLRQGEENTREALHATREVEKERAQSEMLQAYLTLMATLLSDPDVKGTSRGVARAQSLAALEVLNPGRKRVLLQFLYELGLIKYGEVFVDLARANLSDADLRDIKLSGADLSGVNLSSADLTGANLIDTKLSSADLRRAIVTQEQLDATHSLEGATMPNGQKYEQWLKNKEGRGEDGEDSGPS
jgi:hypothetical protein